MKAKFVSKPEVKNKSILVTRSDVKAGPPLVVKRHD
ncbi:hypothetical protein J2X05_002643 [Cellvibrio fibrivorans]|uniref:10 kDa chaperonin n=1 Tax=Cellvibrio fibrivorans TaxID=126350 RepID=A0ABU1UZJ2_9GAMM|nr:hypothetical protein [Cellvibrio fibrivorans]